MRRADSLRFAGSGRGSNDGSNDVVLDDDAISEGGALLPIKMRGKHVDRPYVGSIDRTVEYLSEALREKSAAPSSPLHPTSSNSVQFSRTITIHRRHASSHPQPHLRRDSRVHHICHRRNFPSHPSQAEYSDDSRASTAVCFSNVGIVKLIARSGRTSEIEVPSDNPSPQVPFNSNPLSSAHQISVPQQL